MGPSAYYICIYTGNKHTNRGEQVFLLHPDSLVRLLRDSSASCKSCRYAIAL